MNGDLSRKHQGLVADCGKCHTSWAGISDSSCQNCHEKAKHAQESKMEKTHKCFNCHMEHQGEYRNLKFVADSVCHACHDKDTHTAQDHNAPVRNARAGVLLTHNTFFMRGVFQETKCRRCHQFMSFKKHEFDRGYLKNLMYTHVSKLSIKCMGCHREIKTSFLSATGGGLDVKKCFDCHKHKMIDLSCSDCHNYHVL